MARLSRKETKQLQPDIDNLFTEIKEVIKRYNLDDFELKEVKLEKKDAAKLNCPCGTERVILSSGKIVERCKRCPPPPPAA